MVDAPTSSDGTTQPAATPIERLLSLLENATEESRELDAEIGKHLGLQWGYANGLPRYTASLDAALQLVPEGCVHAMGNSLGTWATVFDDHSIICNVDAATQPLALCIAALRARAAK